MIADPIWIIAKRDALDQRRHPACSAGSLDWRDDALWNHAVSEAPQIFHDLSIKPWRSGGDNTIPQRNVRHMGTVQKQQLALHEGKSMPQE